MNYKLSLNIIYIPLLCMCFLVAACSHNGTGKSTGNRQITANDTLTFTDKIVYFKADKCKDSDRCSYTSISYPNFTNAPGLNDSVRNIILEDGFSYTNGIGDYKGKNLDTLISLTAKNIVYPTPADSSPVGTTNKEEAQDEPNITQIEADLSVVYQKPGLVVLALGRSEYIAGSLHGNFSTTYYNWDTKAKRFFALDDIFKSGYENELNIIAEKIFRKDNNIKSVESLNSAGYEFQDDNFTLPDNFMFGREDILFYYNYGVITSYMHGAVEISVPYQAIKKLLRPNTAISKDLK